MPTQKKKPILLQTQVIREASKLVESTTSAKALALPG
jgi:hypothetical protein